MTVIEARSVHEREITFHTLGPHRSRTSRETHATSPLGACSVRSICLPSQMQGQVSLQTWMVGVYGQPVWAD